MPFHYDLALENNHKNHKRKFKTCRICMEKKRY